MKKFISKLLLSSLISLSFNLNAFAEKPILKEVKGITSDVPFGGFYKSVIIIGEFFSKGNCKYIDKNGNYLTMSIFDGCGNYVNGLANVKKGDKWGFIDKKGTFVIKPQFLEASSFDEKTSLALVKKGDKWGFIDKKGTFVIKPIFSKAFPFEEESSLALVGNNDKFYFIDKKGNKVFEAKNENDVFSSGLLLVRKDDLYGYVDKNNKLIIPYKFENANPFEGSFATVIINSKEEYIDKKGNIINNKKIKVFSDEKSGLIGYKDSKENIIIPAKFTDAEEFNNGVAFVLLDAKHGSWGMIDEKGNLLVDYILESSTKVTANTLGRSFFHFFSEGLITFKHNNKFYIANKDGLINFGKSVVKK